MHQVLCPEKTGGGLWDGLTKMRGEVTRCFGGTVLISLLPYAWMNICRVARVGSSRSLGYLASLFTNTGDSVVVILLYYLCGVFSSLVHVKVVQSSSSS